MKEIDLIISSYGFMVIFCTIFPIFVDRFDILLVAGTLSVIPLILTLNRRRKEE